LPSGIRGAKVVQLFESCNIKTEKHTGKLKKQQK